MAITNIDEDPNYLRIRSLNDKWSTIQHDIDR
jgi:hypothetical protein